MGTAKDCGAAPEGDRPPSSDLLLEGGSRVLRAVAPGESDFVVGLEPAVVCTHKLKRRRRVDGGCLRNDATFSGRELDWLLDDWR